MTGRRRQSPRSLALTGVVLIAAGLGAWAIPVAQAQTAAPASETGWWTRQPLAQPVPDDGFEVGWALEQEQSTAAVRLDTSLASEGVAYLALEELGGTAPDQGRVRVCATQGAWTAANPGPYADRPEADCEAGPSVELGRDAAAGEWLGDISVLATAAAGGPLSLVVQPLGKPLAEGAPTTAPFSVQFASAELRVEASLGGAGLTEDTTVLGPYEPDTGFSAPGLSFPDVGSGLSTPALPPIDAPVAPTATTAAPEPEEQLALGPVKGTPDAPRPWGRMLVLTPISAGLGTLAASGRRWWFARAIA
jgi:hypothetical protein